MNGLYELPVAAAVAGPLLGIPGPFWLFTLLHWLTFTLHLIAMNLLFGGLLVFVAARRSPLRKLLFDTQTKLFPTLLATTITLGVAPLLFVQLIYGEYFYSASIVSAWNWFLIIPILLVTYYMLYFVALKHNLTEKTKIGLLIAAAVGFSYISLTFTMISDLVEKPNLWADLYRISTSGAGLNPDFHETVFRWLHILAGAIAVVGMAITLLPLHYHKVKGNRELLRFGSRIFMLGVVVAAVLGLVYLLVIDRMVLNRFLLSPGLHAIVAAIIFNIAAIFLIHKGMKSEHPNLKIWTAAGLVLAGVFCMVIGRHVLRLVYLEGRFDPAALAVAPQWSAFVVFVIALIAGLVTLWWILRLYAKARAAG
jgi:hypothetical protein